MLHWISVIQAFLESRMEELPQNQKHTHYIFTDSDITVVDDLGHIFSEYPNFHLALTFRNNKAQPLNSGFIAVRGTADGILRCVITLSVYSKLSMLFNTNSYDLFCGYCWPENRDEMLPFFTFHILQWCRAKIFLQKVLKVYQTRYMRASRMLGDQLALAWVVTSHPSFDAKKFTKAKAFVDDIHGASVLFLPCAVYNWTPPEGAGQFHGMPLDVKVYCWCGKHKTC